MAIALRFGLDLIDFLPVLRLAELECGNPECREPQGCAVEIGWLCFGILITWGAPRPDN